MRWLAVVLFAFLLVGPVLAQDGPVPDLDVYETVVVVLTVLVVATLTGLSVFAMITKRDLARNISPEVLERLLPMLNILASGTRLTETPVDDAGLKEVAKSLGYTVIENEDGSFTFRRDKPIPF